MVESYWLNWKFFGCAVFVLAPMVLASVLIWRNEGPNPRRRERHESREEARGILYMDESWRPCLKDMHPAWLLAYRIAALFVLLGLLLLNFIKDGGTIMYYYTQWTFTLVTIYFGLGSVMSIYGCCYLSKIIGAKLDAERGTYEAPTNGENANAHSTSKEYWFDEDDTDREIAGFWGYVFQIIYQLLVGMHSVNAFMLLGDTALNSLRFPWFRISYFLLWTGIYVIFQWIIHACMEIWWPYPFLDLSARHAPLWYLIVAAMHVPCYAIFALFVKLKHYVLSRWFAESYHCTR